MENTKEYLNKVIHVINTIDWVPASAVDDMPTWEVAQNLKESFEYDSKVDKIIEWVKYLNPKNSYERRMKDALTKDTLLNEDLPTVASAVGAYDRRMKHTMNEDINSTLAVTSDFVGNIGDVVELNIAHTNEPKLHCGKFGPNTIFEMITDEGKKVSWTTNCGNLSDPKRIRGVVKEHLTYNGIKQTKLIRVKQLI